VRKHNGFGGIADIPSKDKSAELRSVTWKIAFSLSD